MRGCCNATKAVIIQALKRRIADERCPEVRRGLQIAIYEINRTEVDMNERN